MRANLRIGEIAGLAGTTTRTLRHYHAIGLIAEPDRDAPGDRRYGAADLVNLVRIRRLRALDMPLEQIAAHIRDGDDGESDTAGPAVQGAHGRRRGGQPAGRGDREHQPTPRERRAATRRRRHMDALTGDLRTPPQRHCMRRVRELLEATG
jgi:DNA-binding transcriptional MerR regulator